jgi:hypothetical protein
VTNTSGVVRPGTSPGHLTIDGNFSQGPGGTLEVEVDGTGQGTTYDWLEVTGFATLDGTLAVDRSPAFTPANSDVFGFLTSGSQANGTFGTVTGLGLPAGGSWTVDYPTNDPFGARLVIGQPQAPPEPDPPVDPPAPAPPAAPPAPPASPPSAAPPVSPPVARPATAPAAPAPTREETRLASASPAVVARELGLPAARRCVSRRRFVIRLRQPRGVRLRSARISVGRRSVNAVRRGGRLTATVDLRGLPRGRFTVRIVATTVSQRTLRASRRYRTCAPKRR